MIIRITAQVFLRSHQLLGEYTGDYQYFKVNDNDVSRHIIRCPDGMVEERIYPRDADGLRKIFTFAQAHAYTCAGRSGLAGVNVPLTIDDMKALIYAWKISYKLVSQKFIVREASPDSRTFEATVDITESNEKHVATILIHPDGGAVVASHKSFDDVQSAHGYLISELTNHTWFEYVSEAPKKGDAPC